MVLYNKIIFNQGVIYEIIKRHQILSNVIKVLIMLLFKAINSIVWSNFSSYRDDQIFDLNKQSNNQTIFNIATKKWKFSMNLLAAEISIHLQQQ